MEDRLQNELRPRGGGGSNGLTWVSLLKAADLAIAPRLRSTGL
jgi:hypothetical protein